MLAKGGQMTILTNTVLVTERGESAILHLKEHTSHNINKAKKKRYRFV